MLNSAHSVLGRNEMPRLRIQIQRKKEENYFKEQLKLIKGHSRRDDIHIIDVSERESRNWGWGVGDRWK